MVNKKNILLAERRRFVFWPVVFLFFAVTGFFWDTAFASPVDSHRAQKMVKAWLTKDAMPFDSRIGGQVESVETFADADGQAIYYVVYLRPNGFVIVPADDLVEPVICFSPSGSFDPSQQNPLGALVSRDLPGRVDAAREMQRQTALAGSAKQLTEQHSEMRMAGEKAFGKWNKLLEAADDNETGIIVMGIGSVSDIRVSPLLQSKWSQDTECSSACYNYYTPPYASNNVNNYPCGCVATAMAQYMRFWLYPTTGVGTGCFTVYVDGSPQTKCLRGGNGSGGAYSWTNMTLDPSCNTNDTQRAAIGALTYDAGVAVHMDYWSDGSGATMDHADTAMTGTFGYSNSILGYNYNDNIGAGLNAMINPNLDWGNPVILGIYNSSTLGGHAIVADGYGYSSSTLYHHLNLGWAGTSDAWYNLPNIDAYYTYNVVDTAIYNIYRTGSGEIISGRVTTTGSGSPIDGVTVTATKSGGGTYSAVTNSNGIYAIAKIPSSSSYTVSATKAGYSPFASKAASTGLSHDNNPTSGNCWAVDFNGILLPGVPSATDSNLSLSAGTSQVITLQALDDGLPNPPGKLTYIITSLPKSGTLSDPCAGQINTVPYSLANYGKDVNYTSFVCYAGDVNFHFKANDGGTSPSGGDSNIATVRITVQSPLPQVIYETHFDTGLPSGWTIVNGGSSSDTWRSDNPEHLTNANWTGVFMIVDSAYAGSVDMNEQLITHSINCTGLTNVKLRFKHYFFHWVTEIGDVDIRVNGGQWQNAARYQGADFSGLVERAMSGFGADGAASVQIRWHYYNANWDWYWGVDDVQIVASSPVVSPVGDFNFDCGVDYYDLAIFADAWLSSSGQPSWNADCNISPSVDGVINEFDFAVLANNWR